MARRRSPGKFRNSCTLAFAVGLFACAKSQDPPNHAEPPPLAPIADQAPESPRTRVYFEPGDLEDPGFGAVEGIFGFEPIDATLPDVLVFDGVRPTSVTVLETIEPYLSTRSATLAGYSKDGGALILTRLGGNTQVHRVDHPLGDREQVTFGPNNVAQASFDPLDSSAIFYRADVEGSERYTVHHLDLDSRKLRALTPEGSHTRGYVTTRDGAILMSSYSEDGTETIVTELDADGNPPREVFRGPGAWTLSSVAPDGRRLLFREFKAADEVSLHLFDLDSGILSRLYGGKPGEVCKGASFSSDGLVIDLLANRGGDFISLWRLELDAGRWTELTPHRDWDIEGFTRQSSGKRLAVVANEDGASVIYVVDPGKRRMSEVARPGGVVSDVRFSDSRHVLATVSTPRAPADVWQYDIVDHKAVRWTRSEIGGLHSDHFIAPTVIRFRSFDGREIPADYYRPRGAGPFATVIYVHGGPESQSRPSFNPFFQYLAAHRNVAVIAPNLRGSSGYGLAYMGLDDATKRMDVIADVGALLDWITVAPELAEDRVAIVGVSYGGFVTLASLIAHGNRLVAGANIVGVADIEAFLRNTGEYRRDLRRREYGDERDEQTVAWMREVSPLRRAAAITQPLFIAHGVNDPRVPVAIAEQLAMTVREAGGEVWLLLAQREGHSVQETGTHGELQRRLATFLERFLLAPPRGATTASEDPSDAAEDPIAEGERVEVDATSSSLENGLAAE
jgi:pimeloyl-ACP methyl ester carboxylesterase/Tol biopolymer transport system component